MTTLTYVEGLGHADHCEISASHRPAPVRWVFHHIQPQVCGGQTVPQNLAQLCDNCHYFVHFLLLQLKDAGAITPDSRNNKKRMALAQQGYALCVAAGTVDKIPDEGGNLTN